MSTTTTFNYDTTIDIGTRENRASQPRTGSGVFQTLIEARTRQGAAHVSRYLQRQCDSTLAGLGFKPDQIAQIRASGKIPASFWR